MYISHSCNTGIVVDKKFYLCSSIRDKAAIFQNSELPLSEISSSNTGIVVDKQFH